MKEDRDTSGQDLVRACGEIKPLLFSYMSRELGPGRSGLVREHLRKCRGCQSDAAEIQATVELLKRASAAQADIPQHLSPDRRRRITWSLVHPILTWIGAHHVLISIIVVLLIILAAVLLTPPPVEDPDPIDKIHPMVIVRDGGTNYHLRVLSAWELLGMPSPKRTNGVGQKRAPVVSPPAPVGSNGAEVMTSPDLSGQLGSTNTGFSSEIGQSAGSEAP